MFTEQIWFWAIRIHFHPITLSLLKIMSDVDWAPEHQRQQRQNTLVNYEKEHKICLVSMWFLEWLKID